jgi:hypothetical protein
MSFADWLPPLLVGVCFTVFGCVKLYGLRRGMVGGRDKPLVEKACGT